VLANYSSDPNFLHIDHKPVVFVYGDGNDNGTSGYVSRWAEIRQDLGIYVVLKVFPGYRDYADQVDSWHQYAPANQFEQHEEYSFYVSAGFWKYEEQPRLTRSLAEFETAVAAMKGSRAKWLLVETWNEFHEGTQVEPAQEIIHDHAGTFVPAAPSYGFGFIDILAKYFGS
jgi:hypothetical protein